VSPAWQGKHIGGKFLDEAVLPLVAREGGSQLSLVTNTAMNVFFYQKHGFEQIHQTKIGGVDVWTMLSEVKREE
jgi:acetyltransferase, GNAT family